jgi:hypothetical protein
LLGSGAAGKKWCLTVRLNSLWRLHLITGSNSKIHKGRLPRARVGAVSPVRTGERTLVTIMYELGFRASFLAESLK